jgi:multiple antibiotic resistance protein
MHVLLLAFIPLFVSVDVIGLVPIYLGLTLSLGETERRQLVLDATLTAAAIGFVFVFVGDAVLQLLGVTVGDFQIGGGVLLLVLSIYDLLHPDLPLRSPGGSPGVVPLGIPMIVGPGVLTTLLTVVRTYGYIVPLIAFAVNLVIVWAVLRWASLVRRVLGDSGSRAVGAVFNLTLAAIAATFIRRGVMAALTQN